MTNRLNTTVNQQYSGDTVLKSAIILAGGRSSRMGQDKALLQLNGQSQLSRTVALAKAAGCDQILISRNQPGFIYDLYPAAGPLAGIQAALLQVHAANCLILPVDTPLLQPSLLRLLWQYPCASFQGSPLPAVIPNNSAVRHWLLQQLQQAAAQQPKDQVQQKSNDTVSALSVTALLHYCGGLTLPCPLPGALLNTNTPQQWQQATAVYQQKQQPYQEFKESISHG